MRVTRQRSRKEPALGEDLKTVAHSEDESASLGVRDDRAHDRSDLRDRSAAKVVAVAEASGDRDKIGSRRKGGVRMPDGLHLRFCKLERANHLCVGVETRKENDGGSHRPPVTTTFRGRRR